MRHTLGGVALHDVHPCAADDVPAVLSAMILGNTAQFPPNGLSNAPADLCAKSRRKRRLRSEAPRCGSVCGTASALPKCSIMSGCGTRIVLRFVVY